MSSRAKTKRKSRPHKRGSSEEPEPDATSGWDGEEGIPLTKRQERWLEMFFGGFVFFITAGGGAYWIVQSWILSLVCGTIAMIVAIVLVRRGDTLF